MTNTIEVTEEYTVRIENLACFTTQTEKHKYKSKILGKVFMFERQKVVEYVDMKTGVIVPVKEAQSLGVIEYDYGIFLQERRLILETLRQEVKEFALFVLHFRNKRRGLSPGIGKVIEYYSKYSGKRIDNIKKRLLPHLYNTILGNDTLMMPPFQITGKGTSAAYHLQEDFKAENKFFNLMKRKFSMKEVA